MLRSFLCCIALILSAVLVPLEADAQQSAGAFFVSGTSHGIHVSLTFPRSRYPMNALLLATITVTNVGKLDRYLPDWPPDWGGEFSPHLRMRTPGGRLVYEEELSTFVTPTPGSMPDTYILHPGRTLTRHVRFVLQAPQLQAIVLVANGYISARGSIRPSAMASRVWHIPTAFGAIKLMREPPPTVKLTHTPLMATATFRPQPGVRGPAYFMDSSYCSTGNGGWTDQNIPWTVARTNHISLHYYRYCTTKQWLHAVIGWPDHAVAYVR